MAPSNLPPDGPDSNDHLASVHHLRSAAAEPDGLTARQRMVLETIRSSVERRGYPPSMREIGESVGLTSPSSVKHQLTALERKGFLRRDPNRPRAIEVVHPDDSRSIGIGVGYGEDHLAPDDAEIGRASCRERVYI